MIDHNNLENYLNPVLHDLESAPFEAAGSWLLAQAQAAVGAVLELGCGTGRITIPLAQQGIDITGLEVVPQMLDHARAKAGDLPIHWVQADVRNFHLGRQCPFIFARSGIIEHLLTRADQEAMLRNVWQHLTADGQFVMDAESPQSDTPVDTEEADWYSFLDQHGRQVRVTGYDRYDHGQQIWHQTFFRRWQTPEGATHTERVRLALHYWLPGEIENLLSANGFRILADYGDWKGTPLTEESTMVVYVCAKQP